MCTDCFNGCSEPISDKCVKYTGINIEFLNINKGDSLFIVEEKIFSYLSSILTGEGIFPLISQNNICQLISSHIPVEEKLTLNDILNTLVKSICDVQTQITDMLENPNLDSSNYITGCLTEITDISNTKEVLQATLNKVCELVSNINDLALDLDTNYVKISEIDNYITTYLGSVEAGSDLIASKMIPYVAVEYYGSLSYFNASGIGEGDWANIYLCNGANGTPDKRGRVAVGRTDVVGGGVMDAQVDPTISGNPIYVANTKTGANVITLTNSQIPSHTHPGTISNAGAHTHTITGYIQSGSNDGSGGEVAGYFDTKTTSSDGEHSHTVTITPTGGGESHSNIQPSLACNYIMYIPV